MPTTDSRREAIRRTLEERSKGASDAAAIAEATICTWRQIADRLAPVIGVQGVDVLFVRSLHLTSAAFPWLATSGDRRDSAAQLASLKTCLAGREPESAAKASNTLLVTFTELLNTLIGDSLTGHLLAPVWEPQASESVQEAKS